MQLKLRWNKLMNYAIFCPDGLSKTPSRLALLIGLVIAASIGIAGLYSSQKAVYLTKNPDICGVYCDMALHYGTYFADKSFDKYYFSKSAGSLFVYVGVSTGIIDPVPASVNQALEIVSLLTMLATTAAWFSICHRMAFGNSAFMLGIVTFFVSQLFVWDIPLAQESPDAIALFLGMMFILGIVAKCYWLILAVFFLASFSQTQLALYIVPVILFWKLQSKPASAFIVKNLAGLLKYFANKNVRGAALIFVLFVVLFSLVAYGLALFRGPYHGYEATIEILWPLSIVAASGLLTWLLIRMRIFHAACRYCGFLEQKEFWLRFSLMVIFFLIKGAFIEWVAQGEVKSLASSTAGAAYLTASMLYLGVEAPLKSWIVHFFYLGPIIYYFASRITAVDDFDQNYSPGFSLTIAAVLVFSVNSESRHFVGFLPWLMVVPLLLDKGNVSRAFMVAYIVLMLLSSRFFVEIWPSEPAQDSWLLTWGPWWTMEHYYISIIPAAIGILILACADKMLKKN